jgi:hypothetical protein
MVVKRVGKTSSEKGLGLILAMIMLSLLSLLGAALLTAVMVETWIGNNYRTETQLLYLAESGIEDGRQALVAAVPLPSSEPFILDKALVDTAGREAGRYSVTLVRTHPLTLRSAAAIGTSRKMIDVRLEKSGFPKLADAITLNEDVSGPGLHPRLETPENVERLVDGILRNATDIYTPSWNEAVRLGVVGSPSDYRIVVIDGDCEFGNAAGYGILLVRGELTVYGSSSWNGLILVIGQGVMRASEMPAVWISGGLFLNRTRTEERSSDNPLGALLNEHGAVTLDVPSESLFVEWSDAEMERANQPFPYVQISYREY